MIRRNNNVTNTTVPLGNLRDILSEKDISQSDLSRRAGVSLGTISRIYQGYATKPSTAQKIAQALGVPMVSLVSSYEEEEEKPSIISLRAGQSEIVQYPTQPEDPTTAMLNARLNTYERELKQMREMMQAIADSIEELATRPISKPTRTMVLSEYE